MNIKIPIPIRGYNAGYEAGDLSKEMSINMLNVRPIDSIDRRIRIGQRPGFEKAYSTQIASAAGAVIEIVSVTVVDYIGD